MKKALKSFPAIFFMLLFLPWIAFSQEEEKKPQPQSPVEELIIEARSGSPPVLEFILGRPEKVTEVQFDFNYDGTYELTLPVNRGEGSTIFRGVPYRKPGVYNFRVNLLYSNGSSVFDYRFGFVDFRWGKDNFRFANDGVFENRIKFVSDTVVEWGEEKFGELSDVQKMVLLWIMYRIYRGSIGRCYGFSGGEVLFIEHPELIPQPYLCTYDVPEWNEKIIRQMDYLQNDIVFSNFVNGRINLSEKQSSEKTRQELDKIKYSIAMGKPIVMGYQSDDMHHSMAIYGFWVRKNDGKTVLLAANNWERKQDNNTFSEDAENIIFIPPREEGKPYDISWTDLGKDKVRRPRAIFAIQIDSGYSINSRDFFNMISNEQKWLIDHDKAVIIIEKTQGAYFMERKNYKKTGYIRRKNYNELPFVSFKKIDYNYIFEVDLKKLDAFRQDGRNVVLILSRKRYNSEKRRYKDVNIFVILPSNGVLKTQIMKPFEMEPYAEVHFSFTREGLHLMRR